MAYLSPDVGYQMQIVGHVYVATLAAFTWDWLVSISAEHRMYRKSGFSLPTFAYSLSRIATLGYLVSVVMFEIAPVANCQSLEYSIGVFFEISVPATSYLFFLRVRAVYNRSKVITAIFGCLWIAIKGSSLVMLIGMKGDTLVFLAISYRILSNAMVGDTWRERARSFFKGEGLYGLSKGLLQSGQLYYFVTIGMSITTAAVMLSSGAPDIIRAFLTPPYIALSSALACRVFRTILLGSFDTQDALNTQKIGDIMRSVKTAEYRPEFSFHSETSETQTENMQTSRLGSDLTLKAVDSCVSDKEEPVPRGLDAV
ncbi:hypothetical protein HWV62_16520 [Athelia sp. TMB]|nr:hypothetical protein HWV62_16520 [Athelia sp. TMB]